MRDIYGLSSSALTDLDAIFWIGPQAQANPVAVVASLQSLVVESLKREGKLEPETAFVIGLDYAPVVKVGSGSTSENPHEVAESVSTVEVVVLETSTPFAPGRNALILVRGEDARGVASFSTGPAKEIAQVVKVLMDWSSDLSALCFTFFL